MTAPPAKSNRWRSLLQNLGISAAVFLLCLVSLELGLRLAGYGNLEVYDPDPKLYWKLRPNQDCYTKVDHKPVHINSRGTRGPEFDLERSTNVIRILSLGDSRTFGWGLSEKETYSHRLQELLAAHLNHPVQVINAGVNAWSYEQMFVYFRDIALQYHPDVVVLGEANLWTQFSEHNSPEFVKAFMRRVRLKNLLRRSSIYHYFIELKLKNYYERYRVKFIPVDPSGDVLFKAQQAANPDERFQDAVRQFCELALTNHVTPVLLYMPTADVLGSTNQPSICRIKREISQQLKIPLVEAFQTGQADSKALYLEADPVHVNERGNEIIAKQLQEVMAPIVSK